MEPAKHTMTTVDCQQPERLSMKYAEISNQRRDIQSDIQSGSSQIVYQ